MIPAGTAVRILKAFQGEIDTCIKNDIPIDRGTLSAHLSLVCEILATVIEGGYATPPD